MTLPRSTTLLNTVSKYSQTAFSGITHLLWPPLCDVCGCTVADSDEGLCSGCWDEVMASAGGDYCPACGRDASRYGLVDFQCGYCPDKNLQFDGIARAAVYNDALRKLILSFKFNDRTELAGFLGSMVNSAFQASLFYDEVDLFVPVPLHWIRRIKRGYNQAHILAKRLKHPAAKIDTDLVRIKNTHHQWNLPHSKRRTNVKGAFAVRKGHNYSGKTLCLVDDITTSWATLNECAKTLKLAGAKKVFAVVVAVAAQDN